MFNKFKKQLHEKYWVFIVVRSFLLSLMLLTSVSVTAQQQQQTQSNASDTETSSTSDGSSDYQHVGTTLNPGAGLPLLDPSGSSPDHHPDLVGPENFDGGDEDGDGKDERTVNPQSPLSINFRLITPHQTIPTELKGPAGIDFFILLDISGSMKPSIKGAKENIQSFLNTLELKYDPRIALITFDSIDLQFIELRGGTNHKPTKGQWGISPGDVSELSSNIGGMQERLRKLSTLDLGYGNSEPGLQAIDMALDRIEGERKKSGGMERFYVIIMITDEENYNENGTSTRTTFLEDRFNALKHQERVKFFASLGDFVNRAFYDEREKQHNKREKQLEKCLSMRDSDLCRSIYSSHPMPTMPTNYVKKQFKKLLKNSLTNVVPKDRGSVDISFPFEEQALIREIIPQINKLFPAEPLSCALKKVEVKIEGKKNPITFLTSEMRVEREQGGHTMAYIDDILKGEGGASSIIDEEKEVTVLVNRCCNKIETPNVSDEPKEDECWSESNKQIKYTFKEKEEE